MRKLIFVLLAVGIISSPFAMGVYAAPNINKAACQQTTFSSSPSIYECLIAIGFWNPAEAVRATCNTSPDYATCMKNAGALGVFGLCRDTAYDNAGDVENDAYLAGIKSCLTQYWDSFDTCIPIPLGSVVGALPNSTQIFYAPGKLSPQLFLNPGTYIVTGEDSTQSYYEIILSCQFLWVPKDSMQPSFQSPQNGMALPTRIVN